MISIAKQLEEDGFAVVPEVLPVETVERIIAQIQAAPHNTANASSHAMRHLIQAVPAVAEAAASGSVRDLVGIALGPEAFMVRSLFFDKTPEANWNVTWHQDLTIAVRQKIEVAGFSAWSVKEGVAHVQPPTAVLKHMLTVRLHLDDCDATNGPLQVIPGSHNAGRLDARQISEWRR
jgi:ectoine hydroxylase-related dioxygenase (phytanoyl-CoA dioxygenase family)